MVANSFYDNGLKPRAYRMVQLARSDGISRLRYAVYALTRCTCAAPSYGWHTQTCEKFLAVERLDARMADGR